VPTHCIKSFPLSAPLLTIEPNLLAQLSEHDNQGNYVRQLDDEVTNAESQIPCSCLSTLINLGDQISAHWGERYKVTRQEKLWIPIEPRLIALGAIDLDLHIKHLIHKEL
jgi:hypothetical protein